MEALVKVILLGTAVGTGSLLVIAGERLIWSKNHLPWGLIWIASSTTYITAPAIIDTVAGISIFSDIDIVHAQIASAKTYSTGLIILGFGLGFLLISAISRYLENRRRGIFAMKSLHLEDGLARGDYFVFYCGLACIASFALSHVVDGFDRYNSGAINAPIATLLRSLRVESLTLYGFFFGLYGCMVKILPRLRSIKTCSQHYKIPKTQLTAISLELAIIMFLVLKTGSRSMLAGCLITTFISHIVHKRLSRRSIASILLVAAIAGPALINTFETIRIARSQSDFYKANPIHMARRLATSAVAWPNMNSFIMHNRREEFNDVAFIPSTTCKKFLEESKALLSKAQIDRLRRCDSRVLTEYKDSSPFFANRYLSKFVQGTEEKSHTSGQDWQSRFREVLGRVPESTSKGESINLSGDLFLRGDLVYTLLGGIFLGCSYCLLSLTMGVLTRRMNNEITKSFIYIIPLGLTSGSLFIPIDGQLWLLTTQLPKTIFICFLLGWLGNQFRKYVSEYVLGSKRLSR